MKTEIKFWQEVKLLAESQIAGIENCRVSGQETTQLHREGVKLLEMQNRPVINAAGLGPVELAAWLSKMASDAKVSSENYSALLHELNSAERSLRYVSEELATRINFLASDRIIRSADHSTAIQEGLNVLTEISLAVHDSRQTILSCLTQLQQIERQDHIPDRKDHLQGCSERE